MTKLIRTHTERYIMVTGTLPERFGYVLLKVLVCVTNILKTLQEGFHVTKLIRISLIVI